MKKQKFIRCGNNIYVPPPCTWLEGWTRQRWLERYFRHPERILVTSEMSWEHLSDNHSITILCEKSGEFIEKNDA